MADARNTTESNLFLDYPGVVATIVAIVVAGVFIGALYVGEQGGEHEHGAAPGASVSPTAPAASAAAAAPSSH